MKPFRMAKNGHTKWNSLAHARMRKLAKSKPWVHHGSSTYFIVGRGFLSFFFNCNEVDENRFTLLRRFQSAPGGEGARREKISMETILINSIWNEKCRRLVRSLLHRYCSVKGATLQWWMSSPFRVFTFIHFWAFSSSSHRSDRIVQSSERAFAAHENGWPWTLVGWFVRAFLIFSI